MIPRDPDYGKPPRWGRAYAKFFPEFTDGCSRHVRLCADELRWVRSPLRQAVSDWWEPDHVAQSLEVTVLALWQARREIRRLREKYEPEALRRDQEATKARIEKALASSPLPTKDGTG